MNRFEVIERLRVFIKVMRDNLEPPDELKSLEPPGYDKFNHGRSSVLNMLEYTLNDIEQEL